MTGWDVPSILAGKRLLICEDEGVSALHIARAAKSAGMEIAGAARSGEEAVRLAAELKPDLITMDGRLEGMHGVDAAKTILAARPVCIVFVSAFGDERTAERARELAAACIRKPAGRRELLRGLEEGYSRWAGAKSTSGGAGTPD